MCACVYTYIHIYEIKKQVCACQQVALQSRSINKTIRLEKNPSPPPIHRWIESMLEKISLEGTGWNLETVKGAMKMGRADGSY